ncbi:hypothetical protein NE172_01870 [Clostridium botulinum]|uniref:Uncharacterized protein n=1 Tax=Clostridium botulinum TaxID=1491 RepID=A0A6B4JHK9_CLOBO|nr:hypothetical protein [Clostridium botulinum]EES51340.1 hypothetical protein CLO_0506 [Clostridium botulinum E1 str. 'BoNT E Beluga']MBY6759695.1 hypothetical protein [Clostridium botulinum]MBY6918603.1 hypothetical protein [Clostridium botulinum]MCR1129686.1 hypothetical protein [Clostridium botulinum]NFJ56419.1 hypothetical protein [Clostridium botulinum]
MKTMNSVVKKLIGEITELAYEVTNKKRHDVFVRYSAHVNCIEVNYHKNGYYSGSPAIKILEHYINTESNTISKLKQCKRKIKKLLEER